MQIGISTIGNLYLDAPYQALSAWPSAKSDYVAEHLSDEDRMIINWRGIDGQPMAPTWLTASFLERLYKDPDNLGAIAEPPRYYNADDAQQVHSTIESIRSTLRLPGLNEQTKATLRQSISDLQTSERNQNAHCREQMTRILENAKALFIHRGVAEDTEIAKTIAVIDAVLRNIENFKRPDMSAQSAAFHGVYGESIKAACEHAVANGRNPFRIEDAFFKAAETATPPLPEARQALLNEAWRAAMESVRPQVYSMARELNDLLSPYARSSPVSQSEGQDSMRSTKQTQTPPARPDGNGPRLTGSHQLA